MESNYKHYSQYKEKKNELSSLMCESSKIIDSLSMPDKASRLKQLSEKLANDAFKIQVVSTFNNGKSTLINALLGEDILPTKILPCTAVVNEIKYGVQKAAVLHFRNPLPKKLLNSIPEKTLRHMKSYNMQNIPPMAIDYDKMEQYVTIPVNGDPEEISATSPYETVELFYPSPLLKEGVEIIDTPGLNEAEERTKCTLDYLEKADAIIYIFDALKVCAKDEMDTIENVLIPKGFNDMFFVVNRFDMVSQKEQPDIKKYVEQKVGKLSRNDVYCISALKGLEGKISNDATQYAGSGMERFEIRLTEFLTKEKGRIKLAQPARELNNILSKEALYRAIPNQRLLLSTRLNTLENRYLEAKPRLDELEARKKQMYDQMVHRTDESMRDVQETIVLQLESISKQVPDWVNEYAPEKDISMKTMQDQILRHVSKKIREELGKWHNQTLRPLLEKKSNYIFEARNSELSYIHAEIEKISNQVSGRDEKSKGSYDLHPMVNLTSNQLVEFDDIDYKKFALTLTSSLGVGAGLVWLLSLPVGGAVVMGVMLAIKTALSLSKDSALDKMKKEYSEKICESIKCNARSKAREYVDNIRNHYINTAQKDVSAINEKIKDEKSQVEAAIRNLEKGKQEVDKQNLLIDECETKIRTICEKLDALVYDLAGLN